ncbi:hypothetical protein Tco_1456038 [Tanacetum coccineum]
MCTLSKNMAGWKPKYLKTKSFANVQELFDKVMKRVNTFVNMDTKLVGGSKVREEGSETRREERQFLKEQVKSLYNSLQRNKRWKMIKKQRSFKILKTERLCYYQIIRADEIQRGLINESDAKSFDKEDLETLWKLVKAKSMVIQTKRGYEKYYRDANKKASTIIAMKCVISFLKFIQSSSETMKFWKLSSW